MNILQSVVMTCISLFIASFILVGMFFRLIRHPVKFIREMFYRKKREIIPKCLNDPNLGTHGFLLLEEVRLHYVVNGQEGKPLMLFLHGFPEFWYTWRYQMKEFSKDYRVVAVDMRGYGDSDKPAGVYNYIMDKLCTDIKQFIPALGYRSCVLVAHDWGAAIAWQFTSSNQEMVSKLIVMNCPHYAAYQKYIGESSRWRQLQKSWYMFFIQVPYLPEFMFSINDYEKLEQTLTGAKGGVVSGNMTDEDIEAYKYAASRQGGLTGPMNYYRAIFRYTKVPDNIVKIEKPVLLIWGRPDVNLDEKLAPLCGDYCSDFRVKYVDNSSHWVQMDRPEEVNKYMREFLR